MSLHGRQTDFLLHACCPGLLIMPGIIFIRVILLFGMASVRCWRHGGLSAEEEETKRSPLFHVHLLLVCGAKAGVGRKRWIAEITNQSCQLNGVSWFGNVAKWFLLIPNCCFKILCAKCLFFPSICCDTKQFRHPPTIVLTITVFECVTVRFIQISEVNGETKLNRYHYDNY